FSFEILTNHKFDNTWLVFANVFAGCGVWRLWNWPPLGRVVAVLLISLVVPGGLVDLFPLNNDHSIYTQFDKEPLVQWIERNTDKHAVFLSHRYSYHPLLYSGRKLFSGYLYFTIPAG